MNRSVLLFALLLAPLAGAQEPSEPDSPSPGPTMNTVQLPLARAIEMSLVNNLELEVARTEPLVAGELVEQARGAFDPLGFASYGFDHSESPVANPVQNAVLGQVVTRVSADQWNYETGISGLVPFGLSYSTDYNFQRLDTDSGFTSLEPEYRPVWVSGVRLPLLRDLIYNEANVTVKRSRIGHEISEDQFRETLSNLILRVEDQYWNLAATRAEVEVAEKSLLTAEELLEQTKVQYEVGVVSKVLVTQAEAGVADREFNKIGAENRAGTAQDDLLQAIAAPEPRVYARTLLVPEEPSYVEYEIDEEVSIGRAIERRAELESARNQVEDADLQLAFASNQRLPRLDVTASYTLSGLSGRDKDPLNPADVKPRSWSSHNDFFDASGEHGWALGARVEIPLGNRTARHRVFQRQIELRRAQSNLKRVEQQVIVQVRKAARDLRSAIEGLQASERRRVAQQETLRAEQERLRLGDSTPFQVLEFEEDLVEAELQEIFALRVYRVAIAGLEWAQGTLLDARKIAVDEEITREPVGRY